MHRGDRQVYQKLNYILYIGLLLYNENTEHTLSKFICACMFDSLFTIPPSRTSSRFNKIYAAVNDLNLNNKLVCGLRNLECAGRYVTHYNIVSANVIV